MVAAPVALIAEKKCINWCTDKLTATPSVFSMVVAATAWAHITATAGCAQRAATVAHGRLLPPSPAPVSETPLPVVPTLLQLLLRTHEAGPPPPISLEPRAPRAPLSGPRLTMSPLAPQLLPVPRLTPQTVPKLPALTTSPLPALGPMPGGHDTMVVACPCHYGADA
jgi:hypothetical protein